MGIIQQYLLAHIKNKPQIKSLDTDLAHFVKANCKWIIGRPKRRNTKAVRLFKSYHRRKNLCDLRAGKFSDTMLTM